MIIISCERGIFHSSDISMVEILIPSMIVLCWWGLNY
jgi:hypothetical protein